MVKLGQTRVYKNIPARKEKQKLNFLLLFLFVKKSVKKHSFMAPWRTDMTSDDERYKAQDSRK